MNPFLLLSGYKMFIGLVVFGIGSAMHAMDIPGGEPLKEFGGILAGIGAAHKAVKGPGQ